MKCRVLLVEDSDIDAELICIHLDRARLHYELVRAAKRSEFDAALRQGAYDLVLADYSLPDFDGMAALDIARRELDDVPFIFVSGIGGEELATEALRRGATDYVLKRNLQRLGSAVTRALAERAERARRRDAEQRLVHSEATMRLAMEASSLGLWQYGADGVLTLDAACRAMLGFGAEDPVSVEALLQRAVGVDRGELAVALAHALEGPPDTPLVHEMRLLARGAGAAEGEVRWIAMRGRRLASAGDGTADRLLGVMQDMTATRQLESRQRHTELLFKLAAQTTHLGVWEIQPAPDGDPEGARVWVNDAYRQMAGIPGEEAARLSPLMHRVVHPDDIADLDAAIERTRRGDTAELDVVHRLVRPVDGQVRWVAVRGRRVVGMDGHDRLVGTVHDITDQQHQQQTLLDSNEELERRVAERTQALSAEIAERNRVEDTLTQLQRMEAVGQLTSGVAHDFNNLLTVVLSNIALVRKLLAQQTVNDPRVQDRLGAIGDAVNRGATLTRQLLAFSRRQRLEPRDVDFNEIVLGMRDILHSTLGGSVHLINDLGRELWRARVDPTQMELIILNLAINARDAMRVGGELRISTSNKTVTTPPVRPDDLEPGEYVCVSVSDTGTGMPDEVLARAFEPFFTTKEVGKGSGLGLAQVYGFAKQSRGGVRIDTRVNEGTTVHVFMPRSEVPLVTAPVAPVREVEPEATGDSGYTLLVVDDDRLVREATASLLEMHGFRVEQAADGPSALDRLRSPDGVDLLLADFAMPRMNGAELVARAQQTRPELPVLFMTGYADLSALAHVPDGLILQKPVAESELVHRVRERLRGVPRQRPGGPRTGGHRPAGARR